MNFKSERGYTGIDIATSIVILFIFVSLIATLSYNFSSTSKQIELRAEATALAVSEIEQMKNKRLEDIETEDIDYGETIEIQEGFFRTITVLDYHDIDETKLAGLVKKVTVQIQYKFHQEIETVELSTIISKEI